MVYSRSAYRGLFQFILSQQWHKFFLILGLMMLYPRAHSIGFDWQLTKFCPTANPNKSDKNYQFFQLRTHLHYQNRNFSCSARTNFVCQFHGQGMLRLNCRRRWPKFCKRPATIFLAPAFNIVMSSSIFVFVRMLLTSFHHSPMEYEVLSGSYTAHLSLLVILLHLY
jgi:hypothetical protein